MLLFLLMISQLGPLEPQLLKAIDGRGIQSASSCMIDSPIPNGRQRGGGGHLVREAQSVEFHRSVKGSVSTFINRGLEPYTPAQLERRNLPYIQMALNTRDFNLFEESDANGAFRFLSPPFFVAELFADLKSWFLEVHSIAQGSGTSIQCNDSYCYESYLHHSTVNPDSRDLQIILAEAESMASEEFFVASAETFFHTAQSLDWIRQAKPDWQPPSGLVALTNIDFLNLCNAFYSASTNQMIFLTSQNDCANTAYSTVIRHEFGHAFVMTLPVDESSEDYYGFHEGVADALSILSLDTSCVGLDFFGSGSGCVRDVESTSVVWPVLHGSAHERGLVIPAAFWHLRNLLVDRYDLELGKSIVQHLFIDGMLRNNFKGLSQGIGGDVIAADLHLYGGMHTSEILLAFGSRNLL